MPVERAAMHHRGFDGRIEIRKVVGARRRAREQQRHAQRGTRQSNHSGHGASISDPPAPRSASMLCR